MRSSAVRWGASGFGLLILLGAPSRLWAAEAEAAGGKVTCSSPKEKSFVRDLKRVFPKMADGARPVAKAAPRPRRPEATFVAVSSAVEVEAGAPSPPAVPGADEAVSGDPATQFSAEIPPGADALPIPGDEPPLTASEAQASPSEDAAPDAPASVVAPETAPEDVAIAPHGEPATADTSSSLAAAARTPVEATPTTVMGAVVLGLLPYTIAEGAFGLGTTVGVDNYAKDATVGFGPWASLGVTNWMTLSASVPLASAQVAEERVTGLGNVGLGAQFAFFSDDDVGLTLAATPGVTLPSPSAAASSNVTPDLKASGAVNFGAVALNLTARGSVGVPTENDPEVKPAPVFDSALSLILVNDTFAPFVEAALSVSDQVVPIGAAGLNWVPGGGALLTLGVPVAFYQDAVKPGMSFTAYFETELFGASKSVATVTANPLPRKR